jgi:hypothetical protein
MTRNCPKHSQGKRHESSRSAPIESGSRGLHDFFGRDEANLLRKLRRAQASIANATIRELEEGIRRPDGDGVFEEPNGFCPAAEVSA